MGEIILNGKSYNSGTKYLEVTQAQYNALPASKLTDGTLYCITDAPGPGEGFPPMIYSYEEREVGIWVDGKPLYQKTVNIPAIAAGTNEYQLDFGITTVDKIIDIQSIIFSFNVYMILPYALRSNIEQWGVYQQGFNTSTGKLRIDTGDQRAVDFGYSTITYTKTTDTPGSGTWTMQGSYAHHYSTTEHVIGTWIDGKPLYEKTFVTNADTSGINDGSWTVLQIPEHPQDIGAILAGNVGAMNYSTYSMYRFSYDLTNKKITVAALRNATMSADTNVTLQYIKITD